MADVAGNGSTPLPLAGVRVLEFSHTVMGPAAGLILADLGADVIKVEPAPQGDHTRWLSGFAAGFFGYFNRNKRSLAVDLKSGEGRAILHRLAATADVAIENFGVGTMERLGCGWADLAPLNPRLVYCALKGFLSGPYEHRPALDEVVQFMGGLAYMTGPPGRPMRAGTSVIDITGGMFGVIAILAALREREATGKGQFVKSTLFETTVFLMGQHLAGSAVLGEKVPPMAARRGAWAIYQTFETAEGDRLFVGVTSDKQWRSFCAAFGCAGLAADPRLATNEMRVAENDWLVPAVAGILKQHEKAEIVARCEAGGISYAPVAEVEDLFEDPHLKASGGLLDVTLPGGIETRLPRLPLEMDGHSLVLIRQAPAMGEHSREILAEIGYGGGQIADLATRGVVAGPAEP